MVDESLTLGVVADELLAMLVMGDGEVIGALSMSTTAVAAGRLLAMLLMVDGEVVGAFSMSTATVAAGRLLAMLLMVDCVADELFAILDCLLSSRTSSKAMDPTSLIMDAICVKLCQHCLLST